METFPSPAVLLFNLPQDPRRARIEAYLLGRGVRVVPVKADRFHWPIGALLGLPGYDAPQTKSFPTFSDEMLVMSGFDQAMLQGFLDFFSREKLPRIAMGVERKLPRLGVAALGNEAGILGAAMLGMPEEGNHLSTEA